MCLNVSGCPIDYRTALQVDALIDTGKTSYILIESDSEITRDEFQINGKLLCCSLFVYVFSTSRKGNDQIFRVSQAAMTSNFEGFHEKRGGCSAAKKAPFDVAKVVVNFLNKQADNCGLPDPGRMIRRVDSRVLAIHLPRSMSHTKIFEMYEDEMKSNQNHSVSKKRISIRYGSTLNRTIRHCHFDLICFQLVISFNLLLESI